MANAKPVAGDVYQPLFDLDASIDGDILENTSSIDADGDSVRLNFVNGQRIKQPANPDGPPTTTLIQGEYGTLTIYSNGQYSYQLDPSNPLVAALAPGDYLMERFTFKISDGKGATDFGVLNFGIDPPERGSVFVDFEDVGPLDFPTGYKGVDWGAWRDGDDASVTRAADGNHFLRGGAFWTPIYSADGGTFQIQQFSVANGVTQYDNVLTIEGWLGDTLVFSRAVTVTADGVADAQVVDLAGTGAIDRLLLDSEPIDPENNGPDFYGARYDDFLFLV